MESALTRAGWRDQGPGEPELLRSGDAAAFERIVREPLQPVNGVIQVPQRPGHGVELDEQALARYRTE